MATSNEYKKELLFPIALYQTKRKSSLNPTEEAEIKELIEEGGSRENKEAKVTGSTNSFTLNRYIFETKLAHIKEFCEKHIKIYVKDIIGNQDEKLTWYITQSWLNITKPGQTHAMHWHQNSIISGVFYIATEKNDAITIVDPDRKVKNMWCIDRTNIQAWNSDIFRLNVSPNELLLFPSWLEHGILQNEEATKDRISLSFNVFVKGSIGMGGQLNELTLQ